MATLSWNEIRARAISFANEWKDETNENIKEISFWDDFFNVFVCLVDVWLHSKRE